MTFNLTSIPERTQKPRQHGLTMVMDKGMSLRETEDFLSVCGEMVDVVKLGFGTAFITENILEEKLNLLKQLQIAAYFGGTLFEAYIIRDQFKDYLKILERYKMELAEISDGSFDMDHDVKLNYIRQVSKHVTVISEVGSKDDAHTIPPYKWLKMMKEEIEAGSWKVIAEARESGTTGIYMNSGSVRRGLIDEILTEVNQEKIIWETPLKNQQVFFIKKLGANVNLGNIAPNDVIPLETLRLGLRGDTFHHFLNS